MITTTFLSLCLLFGTPNRPIGDAMCDSIQYSHLIPRATRKQNRRERREQERALKRLKKK